MSQLAYYLVIILLGVGNLALALIAYRQRDKQIQGNQLRETQVELAELRNQMAQKRMEYLGRQVDLLEEIRNALVDDEAQSGSQPADVIPAARSSRPGTRPQPARTSPRSHRQPHAPA